MRLAFVFLPLLLFCSCGKKGPISPESLTEIAASVVSGAAAAVESNGVLSVPRHQDLFSRLWNLILPKAWATNNCPTYADVGCVNNAITFTYNDCSFTQDPSAPGVWNGSATLTFAGGANCSSMPETNTSGTATRTFSAGTNRFSTDGVTMTLDTTNPSGYATKVSGGEVTTFTGSVTRTLQVSGIHLVGVATQNNVTGTVIDDTIYTTSPLTITGSGSTRSISGGTIVGESNGNAVTGTMTITSPLTYSANCCLPTGGTITTQKSGSATGTETMVFESSCGSALLTEGAQQTISLTHCF